MVILQEEDKGQGAFYIEDNEQRLAEMTYYFSHDKLVIDHTEVDEALRGKDVGVQLVEKGVEYAREKQLRVVPACPYVKTLFEKSDKYNDVWK